MPEIGFPISSDGALKLILSYPVEWETLEGSLTIIDAVEIMSGALHLMGQKNKMYASAWKDQGWQGNVARILSKTSRIRTMLWRDRPLESGGEPVQDTLLDLINLCVFAILNRRADNRWGNYGG